MVIHIEGELMTAAEKRRRDWGENLAAHLDAQGLTVKRFHQMLLEVPGFKVSRQAVYMWLKGDTAPSPESQAVIAKVLGTRSHLLFPVAA
jgi:hypothetical protein